MNRRQKKKVARKAARALEARYKAWDKDPMIQHHMANVGEFGLMDVYKG